MRKRIYALTLVCLFFIGCSVISLQEGRLVPLSIIKFVEAHSVAVVTAHSIDGSVRYNIGSGTVLKNNCILTASHMFYNDVPLIGVWAFFKNDEATYTAKLVCKSDTTKDKTIDYAILKLDVNHGLIGISITRLKPHAGDLVIFSGTSNRWSFFTRVGHMSMLYRYFKVDENNRLHLTPLMDKPFWIVYPGGPGDSGGALFNARGELISIMYLGLVTRSGTSFVIANPTSTLREWLKQNRLEFLAE